MGVVRAVLAVRMVSALDVPCLNDEALALARLAQLERGAVGGASGYVGGPGVDCEREGRTGDVRLATGDGELVLATAARAVAHHVRPVTLVLDLGVRYLGAVQHRAEEVAANSARVVVAVARDEEEAGLLPGGRGRQRLVQAVPALVALLDEEAHAGGHVGGGGGDRDAEGAAG
jgi:hypothetical protein